MNNQDNSEYKKYIKKIELLQKYSYHYYVKSESLVSDMTYDALYQEVLDFEDKNPNLIYENSPTQKVGTDKTSNLTKEKHLSKMWSLDNLFSVEETLEWFEKVKNNEDFSVFCEPKLDGASLNLIYENGILTKAITRGNGEIGENVTEQAKTIQFIPLKISHLETIEIRGEVIISKKQFMHLNEENKKNKKELYSNERNLASGSLRQQNPKITEQRKLIFFPHGVGENSSNFKNYSEISDFFEKNNFKKIFESKIINDSKELEKYLLNLQNKREQLDFVIDGVVIKIDNLETQNQLGYTSKFPKWANAFKFPSSKSITKLNDIEWQVGRTGVLTPVAHLEPVNVGGVTVSRVSVYNYDEVLRLNLRKNSRVLIARRGDVIPKIEEVITHDGLDENNNESNILIPEKCPVCGSEIVKIEDEVNIKCPNINCKARKILTIAHFTGSSGLDIKGFGTNTVKDLYENNIIQDIDDLFNLSEKRDKLLKLNKYGNKKVFNLITEVEKTKKNRYIWQLISALGIEHTGIVASKILDQNFCNQFYLQTEENYQTLEGFGTKTAIACLDFFTNNKEKIRKIIDFVEPICLKEQQKQVNSEKNNSLDDSNDDNSILTKLQNRKVVLTGTFKLSRKDIETKLDNLGVVMQKAVSSKTDFLVLGSTYSKTSSKVKKAEKLNIKILHESEIVSLI
jgi:DNA ligase (NAD+)